MARFKPVCAILLLFLTAAYASPDSGERQYNLAWKIERSPVAYGISYRMMDGKTDVAFSDDLMPKERQMVLKLPRQASFTALMKPLSAERISVLMIVDSLDFPGGEKKEPGLLDGFAGTVQLRGEVSRTGRIHSFWLKQEQKNLLSLFFELPGVPVKTGQSWDLGISLISFDSSFKCESAEKKSRVTFESVRKKGGDTIAVLKYDIFEKLKGDFGGQKISWEMSFRGTGHFNITRGKWERMVLVSHTNTSGMFGTDMKQLIMLGGRENVPEKYLKLD